MPAKEEDIQLAFEAVQRLVLQSVEGVMDEVARDAVRTIAKFGRRCGTHDFANMEELRDEIGDVASHIVKLTLDAVSKAITVASEAKRFDA